MADQRPPLETFGLTTNPFTDVTETFFGGADRARQLDELRNLSRWSRRVLAVTGERGVGKTTLYRALSKGLDPGVKAARINANLTSDARSVLVGVIQGFGIAAPANAQPQLLAELISLHVREQIDAKRHCLILIDDAHLLELRALEQLLGLADASADEGLRIVFFGEAYFVQSLDKASKRTSQAQNWHEIRLTPLTEEESRRYITFRLGPAAAEPFTLAQLLLIVGGSSGLPGRINAFASAVLSGDLLAGDERRTLPRMHRALAILVVITLGMGWLIFKDRRVELPPPSADIDTTVVDTKTLALAIPQTASATPADEIDRASTLSADSTNTRAVVADAATIEKEPTSQSAEPVVSRVVEPVEAQLPSLGAGPRQEATRATQQAQGPQSGQWIRAQSPANFTLQLFATLQPGQRDKFLRQQEHQELFATFQTRRDGATWYAVTYGSYANRAQADQAITSLPPELARLKPWIRTFASVQTTLE